MNFEKIIILIVISIFSLTGCASNPNNQPIKHYSLPYIENSKQLQNPHYPYLKIDIPNFSSQHNTEAIVYTSNQFELDRYSLSEWKEPLPILLQEWLLQSLQSSGLFSGVMRITSRAKVSLILESDIIKFQHNLKKQSVEVVLRLTLLDYPSRKIIKYKVFKYQQAVPTAIAKAAVNSFNQILLNLDQDIYSWLYNN